MGLDITAYEIVERGADQDQLNTAYESGGEPENVTRLWHPDADFSGQSDGLAKGLYLYSGDDVRFRAGSYSGYNVWREQLAQLVGTTPKAIWANPQPGPFMELINFSDCEGFIGPQTAAKLATDFDAWADRAQAFAEAQGLDWFYDLFQRWQKAFRCAAGKGVVQFH